jgi:F-type H+-transporting ATPase subunit b
MYLFFSRLNRTLSLSFNQRLLEYALLYMPSTMVVSSLALASDTAHEHEVHAGFSSLITPWIAFGLFCGILFFLLKKPALQGWKSRRALIAEAIKNAETKMNAAEQKLKLAKEREASLSKALEGITSLLATEFEQEKNELLYATESKVKSLQDAVQQRLAEEKRAVHQKVGNELSELVISRTRDLIKNAMSPSVDATLRQKLLTRVH